MDTKARLEMTQNLLDALHEFDNGIKTLEPEVLLQIIENLRSAVWWLSISSDYQNGSEDSAYARCRKNALKNIQRANKKLSWGCIPASGPRTPDFIPLAEMIKNMMLSTNKMLADSIR